MADGVWLNSKTGKYHVRFTAFGRQINRVAKTPHSEKGARMESYALRQKMEREFERNQITGTLNDAVEAYRAAHRTKRLSRLSNREKTHTDKRSELQFEGHIRRTVDYFGGDTMLADIDRATVLRWRDEQVMRGLKPNTINRNLQTICAILNAAVDRGLLNESPVRRWKKIEVPREEVVWLTMEQVDVLLDAARIRAERSGKRPGPMPMPFREILSALYYTAARPSSILELRWSQISQAGTSLVFEASRVKNLRRIEIPLLREDRLFEQPSLLEILEELPRDTEFVFGRRYHSYADAWRETAGIARRLLKERGLPPLPSGVRVYCLRHSRATHLLAAGMPVKAVADLLGDLASTVERRYIGRVDLFVALQSALQNLQRTPVDSTTKNR